MFRSVCRRGYQLPSSSWSLADMRILATGTGVIHEDEVARLAKLASIDMNAVNTRVSASEVCRDINVILNCSRLLKVSQCFILELFLIFMQGTSSSRNPTIVVQTTNEMRSDNGKTMTDQTKAALFQNAPFYYKDYFAVPKIRDQ